MADDDDHLRVVAETSEQEIKQQRAAARLKGPLRDLAANLLRIARGAGKPDLLQDQMARAFTAIDDYRSAVGYAPSDGEFHEALRFETDSAGDQLDHGMKRMRSGALRSVASMLLGQSLQASHGDNEMWDAFYAIERHREEMRQERVRAARAEKKSQKAPGPRTGTRKPPR